MGHVKWRYFGVEKLMKIGYYLNENLCRITKLIQTKDFRSGQAWFFSPPATVICRMATCRAFHL